MVHPVHAKLEQIQNRLEEKVATAVAASGLFGAGLPVSAQDAPKCYTAIGAETRSLGKTAASGQEKCHILAQKVGVPGGLCNNVEGFPFTIIDGGKYARAEEKTLEKLAAKCPQPAAQAATDALPGDTLENKLPSLRSLASERASKLLGNVTLGNDPVKRKCFKVISSARRAIADKMMNAAIQCQKSAAPGSALNLSSCLDDSALATFLNGRKAAIQAACPGLTGAQVGSCDPLPDCVVEAALAEGKSLATIAYPGENCTKGTPNANARTVNVNLNTPISLGGVTVLVRYPRFDAGIDENGADIDLGRFTSPVAFLDAFDLDDAVRVSALDSAGISSGFVDQHLLRRMPPRVSAGPVQCHHRAGVHIRQRLPGSRVLRLPTSKQVHGGRRHDLHVRRAMRGQRHVRRKVRGPGALVQPESVDQLPDG
ncbi:MAG: hypothetical protein KatS3mg077_2165 [Candidatus Binatia bacterium]|nr:MAG: hypothetical protein KatS3mg077_2165 [Candidatus Binatia bacterium]